jgi:long-subunit acyl-CoA synthetase (AMP-forming)
LRDQLPSLRHIVVIEEPDASDDTVDLGDLRARGRAHEEAELEARSRAATKADPYPFIYTSWTTGPPEGLRPHPRQLPRRAGHGYRARDRRLWPGEDLI